MTTFQDPPPQSRRSARQSERSEEPDAPTGFASADVEQPTPPSEQPPVAAAPAVAPAPAVTPAPPSPFAPDPAASPSAAVSPGAAGAADAAEQPLTRSGRRAREAAQQGLYEVPPTAGEPLEYMTQGRGEPLSYQAPEPQLAPAARPEAQAPAPASAEPVDQAAPQFRVRDFSPEGRTTGRRAAAPPLIEPGSAPAAPPIDLEYRTEVGPTSIDIPADAVTPSVEPPLVTPAAPAPVASPTTDAAPVTPQQTLSRREMRQRLAEDSAVSLDATGPSPMDPALVTGTQPPLNPSLITGTQPPPPVNPSLVTGTQPPLPPNPSLVTGTQPPPPVGPSVVTGTQPPPLIAPPATVTAPPPPPPAPSPPVAVGVPEIDELSDFEALSRSGQLAPPSASQRVTDSPVAHGPSFLEPMAEPQVDSDLEHTGGWVAPVGHWSRQADLDDETQPWENTVTREVGGGNVATTTSALVLPEMPRANPFPPALNATGEILLTGSIDLPRSLSSVGGDSRHFDDSDVDLLYDDRERETGAADSAPVSAIRAVSTHTSARGVISSANKPHGNRMLTVLLITAAVMAVGVVGLLIAGLAGRIF